MSHDAVPAQLSAPELAYLRSLSDPEPACLRAVLSESVVRSVVVLHPRLIETGWSRRVEWLAVEGSPEGELPPAVRPVAEALAASPTTPDVDHRPGVRVVDLVRVLRRPGGRRGYADAVVLPLLLDRGLVSVEAGPVVGPSRRTATPAGEEALGGRSVELTEHPALRLAVARAIESGVAAALGHVVAPERGDLVRSP